MSECRQWRSRIIEEAHGPGPPSWELQEHLRNCLACQECWQDQRVLHLDLKMAMRSLPATRSSPAVRERLLQEFDRRQRAHRVARAGWALAIAAMLLLAAVLARPLWKSGEKSMRAATPRPNSTTAVTATNWESRGFVVIPFMPPLASGELMTVVQTKLPPAALLRMGVPVQGADRSELRAELVVGEDGFPRAVRVY